MPPRKRKRPRAVSGGAGPAWAHKTQARVEACWRERSVECRHAQQSVVFLKGEQSAVKWTGLTRNQSCYEQARDPRHPITPAKPLRPDSPNNCLPALQRSNAYMGMQPTARWPDTNPLFWPSTTIAQPDVLWAGPSRPDI
jgi:hypothetical protein